MKIKINDEFYVVEEVRTGEYLPLLICEDGTKWYVAEDDLVAHSATVDYWQDLVDNDPEELKCIVGTECLVNWALGKYDGPGQEQVCSLEEWMDLCGHHPEETWAHYDGEYNDVQVISKDLADELGFDCYPGMDGACAFRCN
jgi:hypothetical protein